MQIRRNKGFTLLEFLIVMGLIVVSLTLGVPSFTTLIKNNRLSAETNELIDSLWKARNQAIAQRQLITVCGSSNASSCNGVWEEGYIAFVDVDGDAVVDAGDDDYIFVSKAIDAVGIDIDYSHASNRIRFNSQGTALNFNGTLSICDERGVSSAHGIIITAVGRIENDLAGSTINCD